MKKHVTIHDIARELNISASTVSRALNDHPRISETTRKKVRELAEKYHYQPNHLAASLRKGKGNTLGVIVPRINRSFFAHVIGGIEEELTRQGYNLMICQTHEKLENEIASIATLLNARVDGIMMSLSMETDRYDHLDALLQNQVRLLFFDRVPPDFPVRSVVINDYRAAFDMVQHLVEQGFRKIGHVGGPSHINVYAERRRGYLEAVRAAGLEMDERWIVTGEMTRAGGERALRTILKLKNRPDALVCSGDFTALGVLEAARAKGIRLPDELAVTGFANEDFTRYLDPPLTTVDQRGLTMGQTVATQFLGEITGLSVPGTPEKVVLEPELIIRESSTRRVLNKS